MVISSGLGSIGGEEFEDCSRLGSVTIPGSVTNLGLLAFGSCTNLVKIYFEGGTPASSAVSFFGNPFTGDSATVYYLPGTAGWASTFDGLPTALWYQPGPLIMNSVPVKLFSGRPPSLGGLNVGSRQVPVHVGGSSGSICASG